MKFARWLSRTPFPAARQLSDWIRDQRAQRLAGGTYAGFHVLGTRAMPAFDDLCQLMNDKKSSQQTATRAAYALSCLGTNAIPRLLQVITNQNHPALMGALFAIGTIPDLGDSARLAVVAATNCLSANGTLIQMAAVGALGKLKAFPEISLPPLIPCLTNSNPNLRAYTAGALGEFGPQASNAIPALTNALTDSDGYVRNCAADALHRIAPATFTNSPFTYR